MSEDAPITWNLETWMTAALTALIGCMVVGALIGTQHEPTKAAIEHTKYEHPFKRVCEPEPIGIVEAFRTQLEDEAQMQGKRYGTLD